MAHALRQGDWLGAFLILVTGQSAESKDCLWRLSSISLHTTGVALSLRMLIGGSPWACRAPKVGVTALWEPGQGYNTSPTLHTTRDQSMVDLLHQHPLIPLGC